MKAKIILRQMQMMGLAVAGLSVLHVERAQANTVTITVAMAANPQMETAEKLIGYFYKKYPDIRVKFDTLPENQLRPMVLKDVAMNGGQFDVVMIGSYEVPLWAQKGWIINLSKKYIPNDPAYDVEDLTKPISAIVSYKSDLYALPFYGSSSFMYYRKDLFKAAGLTMPEHPTWQQIAGFAAKLDNKPAGVSGICLRGLPGWGENLAAITTVINTFGGEWFNMKWQPQLTSPQTEAAVKFYVDLLRKDGEPDAASSGWQECLQMFSQGKTAMWYDDTVFAGPLIDQAIPSVKNNIGFAFAPVVETKYSGWLWAWGLAIPKSSHNEDAAWKFISWVTSKGYIQLAGEKAGWGQVPPGSRNSTYEIPQYQQATAAYAKLTQESINNANPLHPTVNPVPYTGVQYITIPEFEQIGDYVSQQIAGAISGSQSVAEALKKSQDQTAQIMTDAGYSQ